MLSLGHFFQNASQPPPFTCEDRSAMATREEATAPGEEPTGRHAAGR
jgi:hypothetical protein